MTTMIACRAALKCSFVELVSALVVLAAASLPALAQTCQTRDEMPPELKASIEAAAQQVLEQAARGDVAALRANSIASIQAKFDPIAAAVTDNRAAMAGAQPQVRAAYLLDAGPAAAEGRFDCGVFGATGMTANSAEFVIPGLPVGKYAIVIQDLLGASGSYALSTIFQDVSGWKLAGFYIRPETAAGHDGIWFLQKAREFKTKGQNRNAWFYYTTSWELLAPVTFMETRLLAGITRESDGVRPKDIPSGDNSASFSANGKTYTVIDTSVFSTDSDVNLSLKYVVDSVKNFAATQAEARALAGAYVAQYPELKDAFTNIVVHAVDSSGEEVPAMVGLKTSRKP